MIDLNHLRTFVAVTELGHLTQAAERLHLSQPAASAHVKALEGSLGVALFERRAGRLALTPAGHELARLARDVLGAAAALDAKAREIRDAVSGPLRLGVRVDMLLERFGGFVRSVRDAHPDLALEIFLLTTMNIVEGLRNDELDAGFVQMSRLPVGIDGIELQRVSYRIVAPPEWREVVHGADAAALAKLPWIGSVPGGSHDQMHASVLGEANAARRRVVDSDYEAIHATLVEAGVGLALMREDLAVAAQARGAVALWEGPAALSTMRFVHAQRRAGEPAIKALREIVLREWGAVRYANR